MKPNERGEHGRASASGQRSGTGLARRTRPAVNRRDTGPALRTMLSMKLPSSDVVPVRYHPGGIGNWSGHIPFAFDLIQSLRPATFVELGTQFGESYFSFCQAIHEHGVRCSAFAVDTWRGDAHTGAYGEEVFEEVERHNRTHYESFSRLLRMTFDEAAALFDPETIDLLHIDGLHTYEALQHDFTTWFPKVRAGGIVLLHDIEVREGDFGVWRVWEELQKQYQSFSFSHSRGLGVIRKPGPAARSGVLALLFRKRSGGADAARQHYELCADRLELRHARSSSAAARVDVNLQLFWRFGGGEFREDQSVKRHASIGCEISTVRLTAPQLDYDPVQVRLDIAERPVILEVLQATLVDPAGETIWELVSDGPMPELCAAGLQVTPLRTGRSVMINAFDADNSLLLPLNQEQLMRLKGGSGLIVRMRRLSPQQHLKMLLEHRSDEMEGAMEYGDPQPGGDEESKELPRVLAAAARQIAQQDSDSRRHEEALGLAQRLAAEQAERLEAARRLAADQAERLEAARRSLEDRDREIAMLHTRHEEALGLAQRFAANQAERLEAARRSLGDRDREIAMLHTRHEEALGLAQRFAAEQAERLEAARRSLEDRDREIATLREALGAMISSLTWRLSRPLRALVTLLSRSPRGKNTEQ